MTRGSFLAHWPTGHSPAPDDNVRGLFLGRGIARTLTMKQTILAFAAALVFASCTSAPRPSGPPAPPWSENAIARGETRNFVLQEWAKAENRATCSALGFASLGEGAGAKPRPANFSGGWAVAYDKAGESGVEANGQFCADCGRGTFGIAGTGAEASGATAPDGAEIIEWSDGSRASLFLQGGTGPGHLAYVTVRGERCLYNVWTYLGMEHLQFLVQSLRYVE